MTLPELLVSVTIIGLIVTAITASATVVLRTTDNAEGRLDNARSEQSVGIFMPTDLTSAERVDTAPEALPCGPQLNYPEYSFQACPSTLDLSTGSNTMLLTWFGATVNASNDPVETVTLVSYRYRLNGSEWILERVECTATETGPDSYAFGAWTCSTSIVLHDLKSPPAGVTFIPGTTSPEWVIKVTNALAADDTTLESAEIADPGMSAKNAKRVLVTIDGGANDGDGSRSGGEKTFSFSAGGTNRDQGLSTSDLGGAPTFTATRTRCGGNFGLIVDRSGSIGTAWPTIRSGLLTFVDTFEGKPVKLQIVTFDNDAQTVGASDGWTRYFDMLNPTEVQELKDAIALIELGGGTNWEEGWFRMLRNRNGTLRSIVPDKVIFFTDGMPNRNRTQSGNWTGDAAGQADPRDAGLNTSFQIAWNRTARLLDDSGVSRVVGVYVRDVTESTTSNWESPAPGFVYGYEYGNTVQFEQGFAATYQRGDAVTYQRGAHDGYTRAGTGLTYERGFNPTYQRRTDSKLEFQRWNGSSWRNTWNGSTITWSTFIANNVDSGTNDGWRTVLNNGGSATWGTITAAEYTESNSTSDSSDGFRMVANYVAPYTSWETSDWATYLTNNTNSGTTDGWRARVTGTLGSWTEITQAQYNASNVDSTSTDGFAIMPLYSAPYTTWQATDWASFAAGNTTSGDTDGWRSQVSGTSTNWVDITAAQYNAANSTTDEADGFRTALGGSGSAVWQASTYAAYAAGNVNNGESDGWRARVAGTPTSWVAVPKAIYDTSNTTTDSTDGWRVISTYPASGPYDGYNFSQPGRLTQVDNKVVIERLVAPEGAVYPTGYDAVNGYGDVSQVNMFESTDWTMFGNAIRDVALAECGGTVTIQTRQASTNALVNDTFTYGNQFLETVETSASFRSGTFDVVLPGAEPADLVITQQRLSTLNAWKHIGWACTSQGAAVPASEMSTSDPDGDGWPTLTLKVSPNKAVSCVHKVAPK